MASEAICQRLLKDEKWRAVAHGLQQEGALGQRASEEFETLLRNAGEALGQVVFEDLI